MSARLPIGLLALLVAGCRPTPTPTPASLQPVAPSSDPSEPAESKLSRALAPERLPEWTEIDGSLPCELSCADVHSWLLIEGYEQAAATAIELACLGACVRAREAFARCEWPSTLDTDSCASSLPCIRAAWPAPDEHTPTVVDPASDGCGLACAALARCHGQPLDAAEACATKCRTVLSDAQQLTARECAALEGCSAINDCVLALPGA